MRSCLSRFLVLELVLDLAVMHVLSTLGLPLPWSPAHVLDVLLVPLLLVWFPLDGSGNFYSILRVDDVLESAPSLAKPGSTEPSRSHFCAQALLGILLVEDALSELHDVVLRLLVLEPLKRGLAVSADLVLGDALAGVLYKPC